MANTSKIIVLALILLTSFPIKILSQNEEDFHRLARKSIESYEEKVKKEQPNYDSATWHGATYIATSSRGHILPNGFFNYKKGKIQMKGDVVMDFSDINTKRTEEGNYATGAYQFTDTKRNNKYEHEDLTFRLDYLFDKHNTLSFDFFQKYRQDNIGETATLYKRASDDNSSETYEDQQRKTKDFNCGSLVEYLHKFNVGGSFSVRAYVKYDNTPTDIESFVWGKEIVYDAKNDHQNHNSTDTKAQIIYHSPIWKNVSFSLREKIGQTDTRIADAVTTFDYDIKQSLSSGEINFKSGGYSLTLQGGYEIFRQDIKTLADNAKEDINITYRDFLYNIKGSWKINARNTLSISFEHSIDRPTYTQLYPFIHVGSNIGSRVKGNEDLQPSVSNTFQAKYTYVVPHLTLNTILTYQKRSDDITGIATYDEVEQMNVKTWINDAEYNTFKTAIEGEMRFGMFSMTMGARAQRLWYDGEHVSSDKAWSYSFKARPKFQLRNDWTVSTVVLYNGREEHLHWYNNPYTYLALRFQKQLGDWAVYAFIQDILNAHQVKNEYNKGNAILTTNNYKARALIMGCSFRF